MILTWRIMYYLIKIYIKKIKLSIYISDPDNWQVPHNLTSRECLSGEKCKDVKLLSS